MTECIIVGFGGFLGAVCRYVIGLLPIKEGHIFPVKTFIINILGSLIIGAITALAIKNNQLNSKMVLFLKVGVCGGFTTFSSFALETSDLIKNGNTRIALLYAILSIMSGIIAVFVGQEAIK